MRIINNKEKIKANSVNFVIRGFGNLEKVQENFEEIYEFTEILRILEIC